jgi:hypothetical protein
MKTAVWILSIATAGLLVVVFLLSRKISQLTPTTTATPALPADGTVCTMPDATAGTYYKGICVKTQAAKMSGDGLLSLGDMVKAAQDAKMSLDLKFS